MDGSANIAGALVEMARQQPGATAIVCPWGRRGGSLSYAELEGRARRVASGLARHGIGPGTRTVLMVRPGLDLFALAFGLFMVGAVPVLVDPGIGLKHLKACLGRARPEAFIGIGRAQLARVLLGWARGTVRWPVTVGRRLLWGGTTLAKIEALGAGAEATGFEASADDVAAIVFTSGSTGPPKGVVYRHGNFRAQVEALRETYGIEPGEVDLATFPLFALFDPALGMTTVVPDMDPTRPARVDPRNIVGPVQELGVTHMFGSPALLDTVGRWAAPRGVRLPTLRRVVSAGAPVPPRVIERFQRLLPEGAEIFTPYGATESLPVASIGSAEILGETRHRTDRGEGTCVGRPVSSIELRVIPVSDEPIERWEESLALPPGEVGEIVVKGPQVTREYFDAPEHTRRGKIADGDGVRHRMGDLGLVDDRGRVWFCGRKAHRVVTEAGVLYSVPCESVFNTHPQVARSALVGVRLGGRTEPVIVVELDREAGRVNRRTLGRELAGLAAGRDHTRGISRFLVHRGFPVDIRHNSKIDRARLARWAAGKLGGEPAVVGS